MKLDIKQITIVKSNGSNKPAIIHADFFDGKVREWFITENGARAFWTFIRFRYPEWWKEEKISETNSTIQYIIDQINKNAKVC